MEGLRFYVNENLVAVSVFIIALAVILIFQFFGHNLYELFSMQLSFRSSGQPQALVFSEEKGRLLIEFR